jgi:glucose-1-phosphate adenylyltransferase
MNQIIVNKNWTPGAITETGNSRFVSRLTKNTLGLILAGGCGSRLNQLTRWRAKPAVPFGGQFRIIDFALSNCVNSGIRRIGVLTQYKAHSLIRHIQRGWGFLHGEFDEFVELLPAQQRLESCWYLGTADAVYQNLDIIRNHNPRYVLILAGDHIYKMDYGPMLAYHVEKGAELTIGCIEMPVEQASDFGVMRVDLQHRVTDFSEKPEQPATLPDRPDRALISMGIYIFDSQFLTEQLINDADNIDSQHDFGRDLIPALIGNHRVYAYRFQDVDQQRPAYWRDVGTVDAYWRSNLELIGVTPELNLYDREWPIWTYREQTPPAKFVFDEPHRRGMAIDSMISGGCIISGAIIRHSLLFNNVSVDEGSRVENSVILPEVRIGKQCQIKNAIIDKGAVLPDNTVIGDNPQRDAERFYVSSGGVVLVTPDMLGQVLHHAR